MSETNAGRIEEGGIASTPFSAANDDVSAGVAAAAASDSPRAPPPAPDYGLEQTIHDVDDAARPLPPLTQADLATAAYDGSRKAASHGVAPGRERMIDAAVPSASLGDLGADDGPPVPFGQTPGSVVVDPEGRGPRSERPSSRSSAGVEHFDNDADAGPRPPNDADDGGGKHGVREKAAESKLEEAVDEDCEPLPLCVPPSPNREEGGVGSSLGRRKRAAHDRGARNIRDPSPSSARNEEERGAREDETVHPAPPALRGVELGENTGDAVIVVENSRGDVENPIGRDGMDDDGAVTDQFHHVIPEAQLVEEAELVVAEPVAPWYKQRRTRVLLSLVCLLAVVSAVAIGTSAGRPASGGTPEAELVTVTATASPSSSLGPSYSAVPSAAPTSCEDAIVSNVQRLEMLHDDPYKPSIEMDGANAIAVVHGPNARSDFHVVFYALSDDNGRWERNSIFIDEESYQFTPDATYSSAISGDVAMVGFYKADTPGTGVDAGEDTGVQAGVVRVYRRNGITGLWEVDRKPLVPPDGGRYYSWFGRSIDVDGDLACVTAAIRKEVHVFRQEYGDGVGGERRWTEIDKLRFDEAHLVEQCLLVGATLAVKNQNVRNDTRTADLHLFGYDDGTGKFEPLQDPIQISRFQVGMTKDHLVFSETHVSDGVTVSDGVHIFRREDERDPFAPSQFLNSSEYSSTFGNALAIDKDTLVVFSQNSTDNHDATIIFSERGGHWEESLVLDQPYFSYRISGRKLLVTGYEPAIKIVDLELAEALRNDIYAFDLEGCMQQMPTQLPSFSAAPSGLASLAPCYPVNITVTFDDRADHTTFDIKKLDVNEYGDDVTVESYGGNYWADSSNTKMWLVCLQEAQYQFTIYDTNGDGICCDLGEGSYSVSSGGRIIVQGAEFGDSESTSFPIPYVFTPSTMPSASLVPSLSALPSLSPTLPCHRVEVSIKADENPDEIAFNFLQVSADDGGSEMLCVVYDSSVIIDFRVNGIQICFLSGYTATDATVTGGFCDCGIGLTPCEECQGRICVIERGENLLHEKVANCEVAGGLAAIVYNDGGELGGYIYPHDAGIPVLFVDQGDGQFLVENGIGWSASISATTRPIPFKQNELYSLGLCSDPGEYIFSIMDYGGDGISHGEGSYSVSFDGRVIAEGGDFGVSQSTRFSIPYILFPSAEPSTSHAPSSSRAPTLRPSLSLSPTEICRWTEVNVKADQYPSETTWRLSQLAIGDDADEVIVIYDNRPVIDLQVISLDGRKYDAFHFDNSLIETEVTGVLCDCGLGMAECDCQGQICLVQRGNITFFDKIRSCETGGGLATIVYNNEAGLLPPYSRGVGIPAIYIGRADGQYLLDYGLGQTATLTVSNQLLPLRANIVNSHRACLEEGQYLFEIYDNSGDGICCTYGVGGYNITSGGNVIAQEGGDFGLRGATFFNISFNPIALLNSTIAYETIVTTKINGMG